MEDNNAPNNEPSTEADVKPGGGIVQGIKKKFSNLFDEIKSAASRGLKAIWKVLPLQVKIVVIVVILIIVVILALLTLGLIKESTKAVTNSVDEYFDTAQMDAQTKKLYEDKKSLLMVKLTDLNSMYENFLRSEAGGAETQNSMKYQIGSKDLSAEENTNRVVDIEDKLPVYKHILMTEKYNFNKIKWKKYSHTNSSGADLADSDYKEDKDVGLKYPKDSKNTGLDKFVNLTLPYLQTWYIPLAMNTASVVSGTEEDSNRNPLFSYNIIKEAYSNIVVNWYELQKCKLTTSYETFDEITKHDVIAVDVVEYPIPQTTVDSDGNTVVQKNSSGNTVYTGNFRTEVVGKGKVETVVDSNQKLDTSTIDGRSGSTRTPMGEDFVKKETEVSPTYYISKAETFDVKIINEFNYQTFLDSDVDSRINADSETETSQTIIKDSISAENKADKVLDGIRTGTYESKADDVMASLPQAGYSVSEASGGHTVTDTTISGVTVYGARKTYTVSLRGYVEYENCLLHTVVRTWNDKLRQTSTKNEQYTLDDLIAYNESDDRKEKVDASAFCGTSSNSNSSSGTSSGTTTPSTEIKINGKTYPVFNQNNYGSTNHGGSSIAGAGCGLCSITTVIGGEKNSRVDPMSVGNDTNWTGAKLIKDYAADLKDKFGIDCSYQAWGSPNPTNTDVQTKKTVSRSAIDNNLKNGKPVIVQVKGSRGIPFGSSSAHYITLLGYENGKVVIANSAGGTRQEFDLELVLDAMYAEAVTDNGYILINSSGNSSSNNGNNNNNSNNNNNTLENNSANSDISSKMQQMVNYAVSFPERGKTLPYGAPPFIPDTKEALESISQIDCSGFVTALYKIFFNVNIAQISIMDIVPTAGQINQNGLKGQTFTYDQSKGSSQLQVGDILHNPGHVTMYIGEYNGVPSLISQGKNGDPCIRPVDSGYYAGIIDSYSRYVTGISINGSNGSGSAISDTCNAESALYYKDVQKSDGLNRIDFMNSNPEIYKRYLRKDAPYMKYVGYARSKLNLSYWNLKDIFREIYDEKGSLPWVYGGTLGFANTFLNKSNSIGSSSGEGVQAMVEKAKELADANGGQGLWHYCQGDAAGASHDNRRFIFRTLSELDNYVSIGESAGTDCSAFVLSMYLTFTGVNIDPGGGGASLRSYAEGHNGQSLPDSPNVTIQYHNSIDSNIQPGDVLFGPGHVGLYVGDDSQVDQGGGGVGGLCNIGMGWTGPKYASLSNRSYTGYIHYEGLPTTATTGGGVGGPGSSSDEFLFTSGYQKDPNYKGVTYNLSDKEREELQWIVYCEHGSGGYEGMVLQAQCLRDALTNGLASSPMTIKDDMGYAYGEYRASKSETNNSEDARNAISYVFDQGGSAVQHRILVMCVRNSSPWHYTQNKIIEYLTVDYFDYWN